MRAASEPVGLLWSEFLKAGTETRSLPGSFGDNDNHSEVSAAAELQGEGGFRKLLFQPLHPCACDVQRLAGGVAAHRNIFLRQKQLFWGRDPGGRFVAVLS